MKRLALSIMAFGTSIFAGGDLSEYGYKSGDLNSADIASLREELSTLKSKIDELEKGGSKTTIKSKATVLKFSGTHYLGFVHTEPEEGDSDDKFETRRNYLQVKAYFKENPKDYMRLTLDTHTDSAGETNVRLKYAYLYLDNILPSTGVEFGQAHRPWIDYEEHSGWLYRSVAKTFVEEKQGAHFTNSADRGINFKTKTEYFSSELGLFNGEGYHSIDADEPEDRGLSFEWRLTANILGTGKKHLHPREDSYANVSFFGQYNQKNIGSEDFKWYGIHAVYNKPSFLIGGMFVTADEVDGSSKTGDGFSINGEYRPASKWSILARYDSFSTDNNIDKEEYIAGVAYDYNKNVKFIGNIFHIDSDTDIDDNEEDRFMVTAEVKW
jgi:hypothetical protein